MIKKPLKRKKATKKYSNTIKKEGIPSSRIKSPAELVNDIITIFKRFGDGLDSYRLHLLKISKWITLAKDNGFPKELK